MSFNLVAIVKEGKVDVANINVTGEFPDGKLIISGHGLGERYVGTTSNLTGGYLAASHTPDRKPEVAA